MGTGINKIKELCVEYNVKEPDFVFNEFFTIVFKRKLQNEGIKTILVLIKNNPGIKAKSIAKAVEKPKKNIDKYLKKLKDLSKIEYRESNKNRWLLFCLI